MKRSFPKDKFKADMWSGIAEEMSISWRVAEAMYWQLGEQDMAHRAGVVPFSLIDCRQPKEKHTVMWYSDKLRTHVFAF